MEIFDGMVRKSSNIRVCKDMEDEINRLYNEGKFSTKVEASKTILRIYKNSLRGKKHEEEFGFK
jgi:hypothetical protein